MLKRILVVSVLAAGAAFFASGAMANHSWGSYHWGRTANPVPLTVIDTTSSTWTSYVNTSVSDWNGSTMLTLTKTSGTSNRHCGAVAGKIKVCNSTYGNNGWLGLATIWIASGTTHIAQATTKVNDTYFNTSTYNTPAWHQFVSCQEIGHDFGLDHQDENFNNANLGTCMDYTNNPSTNQHPNQGDYDQLVCIYDPASSGRTLSTATHSCTGTGHLDSSNTWTSHESWLVQRPGSEDHYSVREGRFVKHVFIVWANPIH
jgi:hypothetical protein